MTRWLVVVLLAMAASAAAQTTPPPEISTPTLSRAIARQNYSYRITARDGVEPYAWRIIKGHLPPGIVLDRSTGWLAGTPTAIGDFRFTVGIADSSAPPRAATREFVLRVVAALTLQWKLYPQVVGNNAIRGAVAISNGTDDAQDLTFIAVAVNEVGKAFALGYQRFTLQPDSDSPQLELASTLPAGNYVVHVDAVAEVPSKDAIHRARLQTQNVLVVTGLP